MALADILSAIETEVTAEVEQINTQVAATVAHIRAAAEEEAHAIRERHRREALTPLLHERARRLNRARLAALRAQSQAREKLFADALEDARAHLANARASPDYPAVLHCLVEEALAQLDCDLLIRGDPRDEALLRAWFPHTQIVCDLRTWGGVEAQTIDGRIVVVNTLEARLEQAQELLRQTVMSLFDGQAEA
jgi:vacuolar-type H+-ATPase subunit E/Vma4